MISSLHIGAPAGVQCDFLASRRTGLSTRGTARGPISQPLHDGAGKGSQRDKGVNFIALLLGQLGLAGFRQRAAFLPARRSTSCKIICREPHRPVSVSNVQHGSSYRVEVPECGRSRLEIEKKRRKA